MLANNGLSVIQGMQGNTHNTIENEPTFKDISDRLLQKEPFLRTQLKRPDDVLFAENEVKLINNKLIKSMNQKLPVWEKKKNPAENEKKEISVRKKISEIKKQVREKGGLENIDLKNQTYFSKQHLDVILESTKIVKEKNLQKNTTALVSSKTNSLNNFVVDNREISMKNFLLSLLRYERSSILSTEGAIAKALKEFQNNLRLIINFLINLWMMKKRKLGIWIKIYLMPVR